jgi:hypothetical protein
MMNTFMGQEISYWSELQNKAERLEVVDYIQEIANLRAKVSFYESRIDAIQNFREKLS